MKFLTSFILLLSVYAHSKCEEQPVDQEIIVYGKRDYCNLESTSKLLNSFCSDEKAILKESSVYSEYDDAEKVKKFDYRYRGNVLEMKGQGIRSNYDAGNDAIEISLDGVIKYCEKSPLDSRYENGYGVVRHSRGRNDIPKEEDYFVGYIDETSSYLNSAGVAVFRETTGLSQPFCKDVNYQEKIRITKENVLTIDKRPGAPFSNGCTPPWCRTIILNETDSIFLTRDPFTGQETPQLLSSRQEFYPRNLQGSIDDNKNFVPCDKDKRKKSLREREEASKKARELGLRATPPTTFFGEEYQIEKPKNQMGINVCSSEFITKSLTRSAISNIEIPYTAGESGSRDYSKPIKEEPYSIQLGNSLNGRLNYQMLCPPDNLNCEPSVYNVYNADVNISQNGQRNGFNLQIQGKTLRCSYPDGIQNSEKYNSDNYFNHPCRKKELSESSELLCNVIDPQEISYPTQNPGCSNSPHSKNFSISNSDIKDANYTDIAISCEAPNCKSYVFQNQPSDQSKRRRISSTAPLSGASGISANNVLVVRTDPNTKEVSTELVLNGRSVQIYNGQERDNLRERFKPTSCDSKLSNANFVEGLNLLNDGGRCLGITCEVPCVEPL